MENVALVKSWLTSSINVIGGNATFLFSSCYIHNMIFEEARHTSKYIEVNYNFHILITPVNQTAEIQCVILCTFTGD